MQPGSDPLGGPPSFTARRSAASNLPSFELPPPPLAALHSKYQPYANVHGTQSAPPSGSVSSVGNLLTPPNTLPSENLNTSSPPANTNGSHSNQPVQHFQGQGFWHQGPPPGPQYGYHTGSAPQWIPPRGLFSPSSLNSIVRNGNNTPSTSDGLTPQTYEVNQLPPFPTSMSMSAPSSLPTLPAGQQHNMNSAMLNGQSPGSSSAPQSSSVHGQEHYGGRPPPTPTYYTQHSSASAPQQQGYPYPHDPSPTQASPRNISGQRARVSPPASNAEMPSLQSHTSHSPQQYQRPFGQYPLPGMTGPVMSNMHSPGGQMALVGNMPNGMLASYNSGHAASMQHMYGAIHQQQQQQQQPQALNERPFKCDQCVQSFNRNHDLKRHKRIHLAVKPYPCGHCDKSFSRKDALKRHILVKGCGKAMRPSDRPDGSVSPVAKMDSSGDSSPSRANHVLKAESS